MLTFLLSTHKQQYDYDVVKIDQASGLAEFPEPGDVKKYTFPFLVDPEIEVDHYSTQSAETDVPAKTNDIKTFWMPDKLCKVCYSCEEAFTMYRRKHHCRVCGQVFCHNCSNYSIQGSIINETGLVRACRLCYNRVEELKGVNGNQHLSRRITMEPELRASNITANNNNASSVTKDAYVTELQNRASAHLEDTILQLIRQSTINQLVDKWHSIIVNLVREVISSVDPNVRSGDLLDIRPYVKLKIIPGGTMDENVFVDGVVFRQNVCHKSMLNYCVKEDPRILLLSGGIEFERADTRLATLEMLVEQEEQQLEFDVKRIMDLQPDIILVGKSVSRRAQELLCKYQVVVMQNVKPRLLEQISRITGGKTLASTEHMIQGAVGLGTCGKFWLRMVHDDPERQPTQPPQTNTVGRAHPRVPVVKAKVARGSTYAYLQGCPPELGCTLLLRGAARAELEEVRRVLSQSLLIAYHLRLEVAYYNDRCTILSDDLLSNTSGSDSSDEEVHDLVNDDNISAGVLNKKSRMLLSSSLDIDFGLPCKHEICGLTKNSINFHPVEPRMDFDQSMYVNYIVTTDGAPLKTRMAIMKLAYYGEQDAALGRFLVDIMKGKSGQSILPDQTLSYCHGKSRIDINVHRIGNNHGTRQSIIAVDESQVASNRDTSINSPITVQVYCKTCQMDVSTKQVMTDETWKMSFSKFLEINFYNRNSKSRSQECPHRARYHHTLICQCDTIETRFNVVPICPFSIHIRESLEVSGEFLSRQAADQLLSLSIQVIECAEKFLNCIQNYIGELERSSHPKVEQLLRDVTELRAEVMKYSTNVLQSIISSLEHIPGNISEVFVASVNNALPKWFNNSQTLIADTSIPITPNTGSGLLEDYSFKDSSIVCDEFIPDETIPVGVPLLTPIITHPDSTSFETNPLWLKRDAYMHARTWNKLLDQLHLDTIEQSKGGSTHLTKHAQHSFNSQLSLVVPLSDDNLDVPNLAPEGTSSVAASTPILADEEVSEADKERIITSPLTIPISMATTTTAPSATVQKQPDKSVNRFNLRAIAQLLTGRENLDDARSKDAVDLSSLLEGRLGLPPGRRNEIIAVNENEVATIIAYSLASNYYHKELQKFYSVDADADYAGEDDVKSQYGDAAAYSGKEFDKLTDKGTEANISTIESEAKSSGNQDDDRGTLFDVDVAFEEISTPRPGQLTDYLDSDIRTTTINQTSPPTSFKSEQKINVISPRLLSSMRHSSLKDSIDSSNSDLPVAHIADSFTNDENYLMMSEQFTPLGHKVDSNLVSSTNDVEVQVEDVAALEGQAPVNENDTRQSAAKGSQPNVKSQTSKYLNTREKQMLSQRKLHIKHDFSDNDEDRALCKCTCTHYWAGQFEAMRAEYLNDDENAGFIKSLSSSRSWLTQGGKSKAKFAKTEDDRFVVKIISKVELDMFLEFAPAYFEYMAKAYFNPIPSVLCKIFGVFKVGHHNKETDKRVTENVVIMENIFYQRKITRLFDLKGSSRARKTELAEYMDSFDEATLKRRASKLPNTDPTRVLLDDNLMEMTDGRPVPMKLAAKNFFRKAVTNDTLFLSIIEVVDYSILVGFDEVSREVVVGIIDYLRQYDTMKRIERLGKSVTMLTGQAEPTIIQPRDYRKRFTTAMDRYFMGVPDKWIPQYS